MKKRLALLLVLLLVISLVGCNKDKASDTKKEEASKADAPIEINDENEEEVFKDLKILSEGRLDEVAKHFKDNEEASKNMSYIDVKRYIGAPGIHDASLDVVNEEEGTIEKYVFWYSEERLFFVVFSAPKDKPDDLALIDFDLYEGDEESEESGEGE